MHSFSRRSVSVALILLLNITIISTGCAKKAPHAERAQSTSDSPAVVESAPIATAAETSPAETKEAEQPATQPAVATLTSVAVAAPPSKEEGTKDTKTKREPRPFDEAKYILGDAVGLFVFHPQQISGSPLGSLMTELENRPGKFSELSTPLAKMNLKFSEIDRVVIVLGQPTVDAVASNFGITPAANPQNGSNELAVKNSLKQLGLSFHNYHDIYNRFPRADGDGDGKNVGLSWRVHLLPLLEENALFEQFHLDEPWDSEHNKSLIPKMPPVFKSSDVKEEGKTAFQVFAGEKTPFYGDKGPGIRDITDGTSNTILAIKTKPELAEFWTKPGGIDPSKFVAKDSLEIFNDDHFVALFMDGAALKIPLSVDEATMANLIQPNDRTPVNLNDIPKPTVPVVPPTFILKASHDVNSKDIVAAIVDEAEEITEGDQKIYQNKTKAVTFPNASTVIIGSPQAVREIVSKQAKTDVNSPVLLKQLQLAADVSYAINLSSQSAIVNRIVQLSPPLGMLSNITTVSGQISLDATSGEPLTEIRAVAVDEQMAAGVNAVSNMALNAAKQNFERQVLPAQANASDKEMNDIIKQLVASIKLKVDGTTVTLTVPAPKEMSRLIELLKSGL